MIIDVTLFPAGQRARRPAESPACAVQDKVRPARLPRPAQRQPPASTEPAGRLARGQIADPCLAQFEAPPATSPVLEGDFVLRLYLRDLADNAKVRPAQEPRAPRPGRLDDSGREELVLGHLPRVVRIAFDYQGLGLSLSDLIGEGNLGLLRAAELFDPVRRVTFACYARPWIRVQMQRALSYQAWPVSLPADLRWRRGQVLAAQERLSVKLNRLPADTELADECRLGLPAVRRLRSTPPPAFVPLDSPWPGDDTELTLAEVIPDEASPAPDRQAALQSDRDLVDRLIATLSPVEQEVIRLRFGLDDGRPRTLGEAGQLLGYARQGIHRLQSIALGKLRQRARFLRARGGHEIMRYE